MKKESDDSNQDFDLDAMLDETETAPPSQPTIDVSGFTAQQLDELVHTLTAKRIVEDLQNPEKCTPQLYAQALRFLADNGVTGKDIPEALGNAVRAEYADKAPFKLAQ